MELNDQVEFAAALSEEEIFQKLDALLNAGRDEEMHVEVDFNVDYDAKTILSFDENEGVWIVNQFTVVGNEVEIAPVPMMTFAEGTL
jgi:hypothetical protein